MKRAVQVLLLVVLIVGGWFLYEWMFPPLEVVLEKRVRALVALIPPTGKESMITQAIKASRIADYFAPNISIQLDGFSRWTDSVHTRNDLQGLVAGARANWPGATIDIAGVKVTVGDDRESALVQMGVVVKQPREPDPVAGEMRLYLKKIEKSWVIEKVEKTDRARDGVIPFEPEPPARH